MRSQIAGVVVVSVTLAFIAAVVAWFEYLEPRVYYPWQQRQMVRRVLASDPEQLLAAGRTLYHGSHGRAAEISVSSTEVPQIIKRLKPTRIMVDTNCLWVEFSDVFNPFGIIVFPPGVEGKGPHKWVDGLWLYDDGQLHTNGEPAGARAEVNSG